MSEKNGMIKMRINREGDKGFTMYFATIEDVRKYEQFIKDLIVQKREKASIAALQSWEKMYKTLEARLNNLRQLIEEEPDYWNHKYEDEIWDAPGKLQVWVFNRAKFEQDYEIWKEKVLSVLKDKQNGEASE